MSAHHRVALLELHGPSLMLDCGQNRSPRHPAQSRRKISFLEENGEEHLCTDLHHSPTAGNDRSRSYGFVLIVGAAAQFGVKKVLAIPLNRPITAKLTVELSRVPFGCTACRKAVRSPWLHSPK